TRLSLYVAAASFNKCRKIHELEGDNDIPDREWQTPERGRQSSHAAALGIAGEYSADRDQVRVRAGAVRRLHRASRRQGRPVLPGPAFRGGRENASDDRR